MRNATAKKEVEVRINAQNMIQRLKESFAGRFSFVHELLQNSRRAGATLIHVVLEDKGNQTLFTIKDNGKGLDSIAPIFRIAESGWEDDDVLSENPFGLGFLAAIFVSDDVEIRSNGQVYRFKTADFMKLMPIVEIASDSRSGHYCEIRLTVNQPIEAVRSKLAGEAEGFSIPIILTVKSLNGHYHTNLHRRFAKDILQKKALWSSKTPVGDIFIVKEPSISDDWKMFLLGHEIKRIGSHYGRDNIIIHLDHRRFRAKMPDREYLVDWDLAEKEIRRNANTAVRDFLLDRLREMGELEFLKRYSHFLLSYPELTLRLNYLPPTFLLRAYDYPRAEQGEVDVEAEWLEHPDEPVSREDVETGKVRVYEFDLECYVHEYWNSKENPHLFYAELVLYLDQNSYKLDKILPPGHWALPYVHKLDRHQIQIIPLAHEQTITFNFSGEGKFDLELCHGICVISKDRRWHLDDLAVRLDQDRIVIPRNADATSVISLLSYWWDDDYHRELLERDEEELSNLLYFLKADSIHRFIEGLLKNKLAGLNLDGDYHLRIHHDQITVIPVERRE